MSDMITIKLPKKDMEGFLRIVDDMQFIEKAEKGDDEINKGKFKTLDQISKKYGAHS